MAVRSKILSLLFGGAIITVVLLPIVRCNQHTTAYYHGFLQTDEFKNLTRDKQVKKCGTCHKQEYENEMNGPHANAYKNLLAHLAFVNGDKYNCDFYTK